MPGSRDRQPSHVHRPPVTRVGEELQRRVDSLRDASSLTDDDIDRLESDVRACAALKGWDNRTTSHFGTPWRGVR